jgi:hypothetical protein
MAFAGNVPQRLERQHHEGGPGYVLHGGGELIRWPQHDGEERGGDDRVKADERACDFEQFFADRFGLEIQGRSGVDSKPVALRVSLVFSHYCGIFRSPSNCHAISRCYDDSCCGKQGAARG